MQPPFGKACTEAMRVRYFVGEDFDCREFFAAAERRLGRLGWLGSEYFVNGDFSPSAEAAFRAAAGIDDLAEPTPVDIPTIPYLAPVRGKVKLPRVKKAPKVRFKLPRMPLRRKRKVPAAAVAV